MVKKMIDNEIEDKYTDKLYPYTNQSYSTGLVVPQILSASTQGQGVTQHIGDRVTLKRLDVRMSVYHNVSDTSTDIPNNYRIIIFKWNVTTSLSFPNVAGILQYPSGIATLNYGTDSPYLWINQAEKNFSILYDKKFATTTDGANHHHIKLKKFLGNVNYDPAVVTGKGHLFILVVNDDGLAVAPTMTIGFISRTVYNDA